MENPETLAIVDTKTETKTKKWKKPHIHTIQKAKEMSNTDPFKNLMERFSYFSI